MTASLRVEETERIWAELQAESVGDHPGRVTRRVLAATRGDCFLAVEHPSRLRMLSVVAPAQVRTGHPRETLTSGIELRRSFRQSDCEVRLDVVLLDEVHSDIFAALVVDLLENLERAGTISNRVVTPDVTLTTRLRRWQHLLAAVRPEGLTQEAQRGLYGELAILIDPMIPVLGADSVAAWTGPDGALQDFQSKELALEVKTTAGNRPELVRIHGERQLETSQGVELFLAAVALDSRRGGSGKSLPELVEQVRLEATRLGVGADLEQRILRAGYLHTQAHIYADVRYRIRQLKFYRIVQGFPRLTSEGLGIGISDLSYTVDLSSAVEFEVHASQFHNFLGRNS
jgi:putative PD-(D/E)XK family protein DUF4420